MFHLTINSKEPRKRGIGKETDTKNTAGEDQKDRTSTKHRDKREKLHVGADKAGLPSEAPASKTTIDAARAAYELRTQRRQKKPNKKSAEEVYHAI